jgi:hypothetical protein
MKKPPYIKPAIEKVAIDNEISVVLMSTEPTGPGDPIPLPDIPPMG